MPTTTCKWGAHNIDFVEKLSDIGEIMLVTGRVGFSTAYIEQFWKRVVRCSVTIVGESEACNDYWEEYLAEPGVPHRTFKRHLMSAMAYMLRIRDLTSGLEKTLSERCLSGTAVVQRAPREAPLLDRQSIGHFGSVHRR